MTAAEGHPAAPMSHGELCYLQLPAIDVWKSAEFYQQVFGWRIERPYPSFEAPGLIGQFVDDRAPATEAGPVAWIYVDDMEAALQRAAELGGSVLQAPALDDGARWISTVSDPAANTIGLVAQVKPA